MKKMRMSEQMKEKTTQLDEISKNETRHQAKCLMLSDSVINRSEQDHDRQNHCDDGVLQIVL
jgi:hypothetical protein